MSACSGGACAGGGHRLDYVVCDFRDKTPVRPPDRAAAIQALLDDRSAGLKCTFPLS